MMEEKKSTKQVSAKRPRKEVSKLVLSILGMLVWTGAAVIASQLIVGYLTLFIVGKEGFSQPVVTAVYSALSYLLALILIIFVPPIIKQRWQATHKDKSKKRPTKVEIINRKELGLSEMPTWTDIGLAPVGMIVYLILAAGITALFSLFPWFDAEQAQSVGFSVYISGIDRLVAFITLVVIAPIAEEIIFRGWLYGKLRKKLSSEVSNITGMIIAVFLVSLLFGIVHLQWNVGVNVFAMSIVLCGLREITGTIYSGILLHMIKNGLAFYLLYVLGVG